MFRRQTDEVFSTLQQVQRRLSQSTEPSNTNSSSVVTRDGRRVTVGGPVRSPRTGTEASESDGLPAASPAAAPPPPVSNRAAPASRPDTRRASRGGDGKVSSNKYKREDFRLRKFEGAQPAHVVPVVDRSSLTGGITSDEPEPAAAPGAPVAGQAAAKRGLRIGTEAALLLAVLWIGTVVSAYVIGSNQTRGMRVVDPGIGQAAGPAGEHNPDVVTATTGGGGEPAALNLGGGGSSAQADPAPTGPARGDFVLVLRSEARISDSTRQEFEGLADKFNSAAAEHASLGYRPWFGVRQPASGGIQFVFGKADGQFGIPKADDLGKRMYTEMRKSRFPDAFWIRIRN